MKIDNLRLYLKERSTYGNTTQEIFLNEIERIFDIHRNSGDTELLTYEGTYAGLPFETCGKKGYRFVGNHSKSYFDLLFEIEKDDIKSISGGEFFIPGTEITEVGTKNEFYISLDDRISPSPKPDYWANVHKAAIAYSEIIPPKQLDFQDLGNWINEHSMLYKKLGGFDCLEPSMHWYPFVRLYCDLLELWSCISTHNIEINEANRLISQLNNEQDIINCVIKYEWLYKEVPLLALIEFEHKADDSYIFNKQIMLFGDEFSQILSFEQCYSEHNHKLLNKYYIYTEQEEAEMYNEENIRDEKPNINSLKFHLEQRRIMEELGINLPFNL